MKIEALLDSNVLIAALVIIIVKTTVVFVSARLNGWGVPGATQLGFLLSQGSEFTLVVMGIASISGAMPGNWSSVITAAVALTLVAASLRGAEWDVARLESRAAEGGTTLTELADHLARTHDVPFMTAHAIAARLMQARRERPDAALAPVLAAASADLLGAPLEYSEAQLAEVMSPRHFVEVRSSRGGPAPAETAR